MPNYTVKTPNFSYILSVTEKKSPFHTIEFVVGEKSKPCLEASIFLPDIDEQFKDLAEIATLQKIDALEQCALKWDEEKSFGTELLYSFIEILSSNYPHVKTIKLSDASYIPCNRRDDTLDLLTYSIALYGKTWYELKAGAYLPFATHRTMYEKEVQKYIDPLTKTKTPFTDIFGQMIGNTFTRDYMGNDFSTYETMYTNAHTFPEFFLRLSKKIPKKLRCKFFKGWLEFFINGYVHIGRDWYIDIQNNEILKK